ncbi:NUDIX hydrolase [bacterium]|uniref:NUDIX hydrolase n=2 Tax=Katanobacteria TaxID=422282 RepID=A0A2M7X1S8_UNCKA|nr:NUDIX hydrolase [bacterium]PIP56187.1 MAG: NUDIX hydrolase [candidate division WWE3 bacterium CG22_combo_CG10-13_8_21_14_all_39_12]PJA40125.1 MAG: NUDIX hydrolase [candidate division WWE3 bacterium CG_4_9_14_3_um_filter_39_7]
MATSLPYSIVATDVVIFSLIENRLHVLLLELKEDPFVGMCALPGGLVQSTETIDASAKRHLKEKAGVSNNYMEQLYTFGEVDRDPRGRVISVAYMALVLETQTNPQTIDRYAGISWYPVSKLPSLAYDHAQIIVVARERLVSKLGYSNIIFALLPQEFTLTQLQDTYELLLEEPLDKRNFRKKVLSLDIIEKTGNVEEGVKNRPAAMYSFTSRVLKQVNIL